MKEIIDFIRWEYVLYPLSVGIILGIMYGTGWGIFWGIITYMFLTSAK